MLCGCDGSKLLKAAKRKSTMHRFTKPASSRRRTSTNAERTICTLLSAQIGIRRVRIKVLPSPGGDADMTVSGEAAAAERPHRVSATTFFIRCGLQPATPSAWNRRSAP